MKILSKFYVGIIYAFLYLPIAVLIVFSFNDAKSRTVFTDFTFKWYEKLFTNDIILGAFANTLFVALVAGIGAVVLGTFAAIGINAMNKKLQSLLLNVTYLPMINPDIITGVSLMLLFVFIRMELGFTSLILAHITFNHLILCRLLFFLAAILPRRSEKLYFPKSCPESQQDFFFP